MSYIHFIERKEPPMSVSLIRFKSMAEVNAAVKRCHFIEHEVGQDERGYFFKSYTLDPRVVKINEELDARARANRLARAVDAEVSGVEPKPERKSRPVKTDGPVHRIRDWARANPEATPADAVAHFADLHPATVKIQLRKVRKGLV